MEDLVLKWAEELQSLAQAGLYYAKDVFDLERYRRIREIAAEMMQKKSGLSLETVKDLFCSDSGYQTPKIDTRSAVFRDGKILLVRETTGRWSLPGGWCDYDLTPAQNAVKETKEEAGIDVHIKRLICVHDKNMHNPPFYVFRVTKFFFLCEAEGGSFTANPETTESRWFAEDELPELETGKTNEEQIHICFACSRSDHWTVPFD
ncbi:MAG: NUDIX hydrolase [Solobacterium sp.]|nr:NUDIX hydrolase [Solobacterium sp.]